jgi:hypothetical protein
LLIIDQMKNYFLTLKTKHYEKYNNVFVDGPIIRNVHSHTGKYGKCKHPSIYSMLLFLGLYVNANA